MLLDYSMWMKSWGASQRTIDARLTTLRALVRAQGPTRLLGPAEIAEFLSADHLAPWSRRTYYNTLASFYGWAVDTGRLERDPMQGMRKPVTPKGLPRPLTDDEVDRVLAAAKGNVREWFLLGLLAGLRAHEIGKVHDGDVTVSTIKVIGKGRKEAHLPTHPELWEIAKTKRSGYWYPTRSEIGHVRSASVSRGVARLFADLGIEGSIHRARHTYGTRLLRGGVNLRVVQTLMRHESLATTQLYLEVTEDERMNAIHALKAC